jgi:predicted house-cleaning noncanonical NTP pyrophosphatase (MazG superfamily)
MPRKIQRDFEMEALHERVKKVEEEVKEFIKAQRTRDTSIFLALVSAVISAVVKAMFAG